MKKSNQRIAASIFLVIVMCIGMLFTGCKNSSEDAENAYSAIAGVYTSKIVMSETQSVDLYLKISEDGSFVFCRDTEFSSNEKGAGTLGKTEEGDTAFFYTIINGEEVEEGGRVSTYELNDDGSIQFTSPMWFGSTEPKIIADDESVSYPCFVKYEKPQVQTDESTSTADEEETTSETTTEETSSEQNSDKAVSSTKAASTVGTTKKAQQTTTAATTKKAAQPAQSALQEGTYTGSMSKYVDAMSSNAKYDVTVTFNGGKYDYRVKITISGSMEYTDEEHYTGTYTVNGNSLSMTGELSSGTINGSSVVIKGHLSSFAGSEEKLTVFK